MFSLIITLVVILNLLLFMLTVSLHIVGIIYLIRFKDVINTVDKILLLIPIFVPVKSIRENIVDKKKFNSINKYLRFVSIYKVYFIIDMLITFAFFLFI